ncbi:hypothetical protein HKD37_15G043825 [Glycine soja]
MVLCWIFRTPFLCAVNFQMRRPILSHLFKWRGVRLKRDTMIETHLSGENSYKSLREKEGEEKSLLQPSIRSPLDRTNLWTMGSTRIRSLLDQTNLWATGSTRVILQIGRLDRETNICRER